MGLRIPQKKRYQCALFCNPAVLANKMPHTGMDLQNL